MREVALAAPQCQGDEALPPLCLLLSLPDTTSFYSEVFDPQPYTNIPQVVREVALAAPQCQTDEALPPLCLLLSLAIAPPPHPPFEPGYTYNPTPYNLKYENE